MADLQLLVILVTRTAHNRKAVFLKLNSPIFSGIFLFWKQATLLRGFYSSFMRFENWSNYCSAISVLQNCELCSAYMTCVLQFSCVWNGLMETIGLVIYLSNLFQKVSEFVFFFNLKLTFAFVGISCMGLVCLWSINWINWPCPQNVFGLHDWLM